MSSKGHRIVNGVSKELCRKHNIEKVGNAYRFEDDLGLSYWIRKDGAKWFVVLRQETQTRFIGEYKTFTAAIKELTSN